MAQGKAASYGLDSLSRLPDGVLFHIVSLLPMKDAVRTSVLSTRWRHLYASRSSLEFCSSGRKTTCVDIINAVDHVFYYRYSRPINRFQICWSYPDRFDPKHIYGWIKCVMWHGIQELDIDIPENLLLPDSLFTCKTLVVLRLKLYFDSDSDLEIPAKVFLPSLKVLVLHTVICFSDDYACERLLSNCPVLEHFDYSFLQEKECHLIICHPTLKRLAIRDHAISCERFEIVVDAPSVTHLEYSIISFGCDTQIDLRSLIEAEISFDYKDGYMDFGIKTHALNAESVITGINNVRKLNMSGGTLMFFQDYKIPLPVFHNLTHLVITSADYFGMGGMLLFLSYCDSLETLDLKELPVVYNIDLYIQESSRATCLSFKLKTVSISTFKGNANEMDIIKYLLLSAGVLETLKIGISDIKREELSKTRELLLTLPRASNKCSIVLVDE